MKQLITFLLLSFCQAMAYAGDRIVVDMLTPLSPKDQIAFSEIKESQINESLVEIINAEVPFYNSVKIEYGSEDGPLYDTERHTVQIPYSFYTESKQLFQRSEYQEHLGKSADEAAIDALLHTLLHELGHAYVADAEIPILGKEEDAVDNFATIMLLNFFDGGASTAISAAELFALENDELPEFIELSEYAGEHSFDLQRYFSTLCLVYGSNPEKHSNLLDEIEEEGKEDSQMLEYSKDMCMDSYDIADSSWRFYLE